MDLLWIGVGLGLAAGLSPGPLQTLVIATSLERGFVAGVRVAIAPLITDAPIVVVALLLLGQLPDVWLNAIAGVGGCVVIYLGIATLRRGRQTGDERQTDSVAADLTRGAFVNLFNPHPWIFWATVQGPLLIDGWRRHPLVGIGFVTAFYLSMVGSKIGTAWLVARTRHRLTGRWYRVVLVGCALLLVGMGIFLILQAVGIARPE